MFYANATIQQVDVPATNQSFGILANHVPTIAVLQPGVVIVTEENGEKKKFFGLLIFLLAIVTYNFHINFIYMI